MLQKSFFSKHALIQKVLLRVLLPLAFLPAVIGNFKSFTLELSRETKQWGKHFKAQDIQFVIVPFPSMCFSWHWRGFLPAFVNTVNSLKTTNICGWNPELHNGAKETQTSAVCIQ